MRVSLSTKLNKAVKLTHWAIATGLVIVMTFGEPPRAVEPMDPKASLNSNARTPLCCSLPLQEANIVTNPPAEYGWKYGGIANVGMKSGTNDIHGTAFALGRDSAFETKPAFLLPNQKPSDQLEQMR